MLRKCPYSMDALMIHRPPMLLLDEVIGFDDKRILAGVHITESSGFITPKGVPGHVAIEYMAQACGAYAGAIALDQGLPVTIGLLIGTRRCSVQMPWFRIDDRLLVSAAIVFRDEQLAAFDCKIEVGGKVVAEAQLKVYQPDKDFLKKNGSSE
jgi:predicted hotdog family 3-hydroxylacyl-ACP dehydratase